MIIAAETEKVQTPILYFRLLLAAGDAIVLNFSAAVESGSSFFTLNVASDPQKPLTLSICLDRWPDRTGLEYSPYFTAIPEQYCI
jgi:hypothetical protein